MEARRRRATATRIPRAGRAQGPMVEQSPKDGILVRAKAGDVYSEPIRKMHRGHNPHDTIPYLYVAFCVSAPDRDHVTNVVQAFEPGRT